MPFQDLVVFDNAPFLFAQSHGMSGPDLLDCVLQAGLAVTLAVMGLNEPCREANSVTDLDRPFRLSGAVDHRTRGEHGARAGAKVKHAMAQHGDEIFIDPSFTQTLDEQGLISTRHPDASRTLEISQ
jgi:hypothetical protein